MRGSGGRRSSARPNRAVESGGLDEAWRGEDDMSLMTEDAQASPERAHYMDLVQEFPLRPLRSGEELAQAIRVIDRLIVRGDLDSGEQDYLDVLTDLVEKYEAEEHPMPPVSDAAMLRHLIEARGITQLDSFPF